MRDYLLDIVKHTVPLGAFVTLRIDGSDGKTEISSTETEKLMVLQGKTHLPVSDFKGLFGIPNIGLLNTVLSIPEYTTDAKCSVTTQQRDNGLQPTAVHFENATGDFSNDFRLMVSNVIDTVEPKLKFNVTSWLINFVPSLSGQQRLRYQASAHPEEKAVTFKIENGNITGQLGSVSSHFGSFVFHSGVDAKIKKTISVPVKYVNSILALDGDKIFYIGELGVMISVDSGLAQYNYILPTLSK